MDNDLLFSPDVAIEYLENINYPEAAPFDPPEIFPELTHFSFHTDPSNKVYCMVRNSFYQLGLDKEHFGSNQWNPFMSFVKSGDNVVIKPNAVYHHNRCDTIFASITHPSVIRVIIDYCLLALKEDGSITIADCPVMSSDFSKWMQIMHIPEILEYYKKRTTVHIRCLDLRQRYVDWKMGYTPTSTRKELNLDPLGYIKINLKKESAFNSLTQKEINTIYGADDLTKETIELHSHGNHIYDVSNTILDSDVLISIPKLKVHKKVGITLNLKGMVGTIGNKNSIPHFRKYSPDHGGDEYPDDLPKLQKFLFRYRMHLITKIRSRHTRLTDLLYLLLDSLRRVLQFLLLPEAEIHKKMLGGGWHGNDTAWRMGVDLMKIALYGRKNVGSLTQQPRRFFSVVDGIIGGEDDGPLAPTARTCGVILSAFNPVAIDWTAARLINLDPARVKLLVSARNDPKLVWKGSNYPVIRSNSEMLRNLWMNNFCIPFLPPIGWLNQVELFPDRISEKMQK